MYYLSDTYSSVNDPGTYAVYETVRVGSQYDGSGISSYEVGDSSGPLNSNDVTWGSDGSGSLDTGNVSVTLNSTTSGGSLSVGSDSRSYSDSPFTTISSVKLVAGVLVPAKASWSDVSVEFLKNGVVEEIDNVGTGPQVDTRATPNSPQAEQDLIVTPNVNGCNQVIITGTVHLTAPTGTYPGANDIFCNAYVCS